MYKGVNEEKVQQRNLVGIKERQELQKQQCMKTFHSQPSSPHPNMHDFTKYANMQTVSKKITNNIYASNAKLDVPLPKVPNEECCNIFLLKIGSSQKEVGQFVQSA